VQSTANYPVSQFPTGEPTSALTFGDLILAAAIKARMAYYGADGQSVPSIPIDPHDLALLSDVVNKGVRMLISDGPGPNGWRWLNQVSQVDLYPEIDYNPGTTYLSMVYDTVNVVTTCTLITGVTGTVMPHFTQSMELQNMWIGGYPTPGTPGYDVPAGTAGPGPYGTAFAVAAYLAPNAMVLYGDATQGSGTATQGFSIVTTGDYTLPADFTGQYSGPISFIQGTSRGVSLHWVDEYSIRARRQIYTQESGTPFEAALRLFPRPSYDSLQVNGQPITPANVPGFFPTNRRRYQLMTWFAADEFLSVIFPFIRHFDSLVSVNDVPPWPVSLDEAGRAAVMAVVEKDIEDTDQGPDWVYYRQVALQNAYRIDSMSVAKSIGKFQDPGVYAGERGLRDWRSVAYVRPLVDVLAGAYLGGN
jgi:hypothetical protein